MRVSLMCITKWTQKDIREWLFLNDNPELIEEIDYEAETPSYAADQYLLGKADDLLFQIHNDCAGDFNLPSVGRSFITSPYSDAARKLGYGGL